MRRRSLHRGLIEPRMRSFWMDVANIRDSRNLISTTVLFLMAVRPRS